MDEWPKVTWCSVVESLVCHHCHLELDMLWNSQPAEADDSISDVVTENQKTRR